jgi:hypothetical protein
MSKGQKAGSYLVVVRFDAECNVENKLTSLPGFRLKNKTMAKDFTELVAEVRLGGNSMLRLESLRNEEGVQEISIMRSTNGSML